MKSYVPYVVLVSDFDESFEAVEEMAKIMPANYNGSVYHFVVDEIGSTYKNEAITVLTLDEFVKDFNNSDINEQDYYIGYFMQEIA